MSGELEKLEGADLPVLELDEALPHLRRPFAPAAVKWKAQSSWQGGAMIVAHIDARLVVERLNAVVAGAWHDDYVPANPAMRCDLTVLGTTRKSFGLGTDMKALESDALKRAGVKWGIGVSVYSLARVYFDAGKAAVLRGAEFGVPIKQKERSRGDKKVYLTDITPAGAEYLKAAYTAWLDEVGVKAFGPVLDHGDQEDAQGVDDETAPAVAPAEDALPALEDDRAKELREACERAFERLQEADPAAMLPGAFRGELEKASVSHEALVALQERIDGMARGSDS